MTKKKSTPSTPAVNEYDLEGILDQLNNLPDPQDDEDEEVGYDRRVVIEFPEEVSLLYCLRGLSIPIRDILEVISERLPGLSKILGEIRDGFYAGDDHDDHECRELVGHVGPSSVADDEAGAEIRLMLAAGAEERAMRREAVEEDLERDRIDDFVWGLTSRPPNLEPLQRDAEEIWSEMHALAEFYQSELDKFVGERSEWGGDRPTLEQARRDELDAIRIRLNQAADLASSKEFALISKWRELTYGAQNEAPGAPG